MKLVSITTSNALPLPGINARSTMTIEVGPDGLGVSSSFREWSFHVRGPSVFFVSPPGWQIGKPREGDERQVFEIPRSSLYLGWKMSDADKLEDVVKFSPPDRPKAKPAPVSTTPALAAEPPSPQARSESPAADAAPESSPIASTAHPEQPDEPPTDDEIPEAYKAARKKKSL